MSTKVKTDRFLKAMAFAPITGGYKIAQRGKREENLALYFTLIN